MYSVYNNNTAVIILIKWFAEFNQAVMLFWLNALKCKTYF